MGFVGIGANSPSAKLHVNSANLGSGGDNWIAGNFGGLFGDRVVMGLLDGKPTIGGHNNGLTDWADMIINPGGGNVGIGTNTPTLAKLMVVGSSNATFAYGWLAGAGNTGFTNTSTNPYSISMQVPELRPQSLTLFPMRVSKKSKAAAMPSTI